MRILLAIFALSFSSLLVAQNAEEKKVYVTETGERYHQQNCRYLKYSKTELSLKDAKERGYTPCKVCRPTGASSGQGSAKTESHTPAPKTTNTRCQATTKKGTQCSRSVTSGSRYCWQHP